MKPVSPNSAPSIIGSDVSISGDVTTTGEIQLDGTVEGDVRSAALTVGEHGSVKGAIMADNVVVKGSVSGEIRGRSIRLEKSAKVNGDILHETLSVEAGAFIEGKLAHKENPLQGNTAKPAQVAPTIKPEDKKTA